MPSPLAACLLALLPPLLAAPASPCAAVAADRPMSAGDGTGHVLVLRAGPDGPAVHALPIADGETLVLPGGPAEAADAAKAADTADTASSADAANPAGAADPPDSPNAADTAGPVITVILPVGPGGSASLEPTAAPRRWVVSRRGEVLHVHVESPDGAQLGARSRALSALRGEDVRISVTPASGPGAAFLVLGYERVLPDDGPVIDMFGGRVPMQAGDFVVCTRSTAVRAPGALSGSVPLLVDGHLFVQAQAPDGEPAWFVVDLGAGTTVVARSFLGDGVAVTPVEMVEHSAAGSRRLAYTLGGATGEVLGFAGAATLPVLAFGDVVFRDADVMVMDALPALAGRPLAGILGVDLLSRADAVSLGYRDGAALHLRSGTAPPHARDEVLAELPLSLVGRTLYVRGAARDVDLHLVLDTGSTRCLMDERTADALGLTTAPADEQPIRGLGGQPLEVRRAQLERLQLGALEVDALSFDVGALPVFDPIARGQHPALLGGPFFARFGRVEVDFAQRRLRLFR